MKKFYFLILLTVVTQSVMACAICGCSSGNYFIGPFPQFKKHFIGVRYTFRSFETRIAGDATQYSHDFYQTTELWGGFNVGKRWQVIGFLPYSFNRQNSDDGIVSNKGLGDLTAVVNYKLLTRGAGTKVIQSLWIGGGIKAPTGKYSLDPDDLVPSANRQPGTGSTDFLINTMYAIQFGKWGVSSNANYKLNRSAQTFQFGNKLSASGFLFRQFTKGATTLSPTAGLLYEKLAANKQAEVKVADTGGTALLGALGLETNLRIFTVGFNVQMPIAQNFSNKQTETKVRGMVHLTYTF